MDGSAQFEQEDLYVPRVVLTALYLPGLVRAVSPKRATYREVLRVLLLHPGDLGGAAARLEEHGCWEAALALSHPHLLARAEELISRSKALTALCGAYPAGWSSLSSAPPALWLEGDLPGRAGLGVVGSREPPETASAFAREVALQGGRLGYAIVSGGAPGCDWEAGRAAAGNLVELLPCGTANGWGVGSGCRLSARDPKEPFSTAAAMERNALIYSYGQAAVLCHARFKTGGAWTGATEALRRKRGRLLVWSEPSNLASRALVALGGVPLPSAGELEEALSRPPGQPNLFTPSAC